MPPATDIYAISRLDLPGSSTHGWQVRMQRRGIRYGKFFSDRTNGGPTDSLHAACTWRDELLARFAMEEAPRICQRSSRNSSGVIGVSRVMVSAANGLIYHFWQASWCPATGETRSIRFSIKRHGDKQAYRLAVQARRAGTGL